MKRYLFFSVCILVCICSLSMPRRMEPLQPVTLRCEYLDNPLGIDRSRPRLSWQIRLTHGGLYNQRQTAYQILTASSPDKLNPKDADLWNSGKIVSDNCAQVLYEGKEPGSEQACWWKVRIWDQRNKTTAWSEPAMWSMGPANLLETAQWIGDRPDAAQRAYREMLATYDPASGKPLQNTPPPTPPSPILRKSFAVDGTVSRAMLYVTALGLYEMHLNGEKIGDRLLTPEWTNYDMRVLYQAYDLTDRIVQGENALSALLGDGWYLSMLGPIKWHGDYPRRGVYGDNRRLLALLVIEKADGARQIVATDDSWKIQPDGFIRSADNFRGETVDARMIPKGWNLAGFDDSSWGNAYTDASVRKTLEAQRHEPIRATEVLKPVRVDDRGNGKYIVDFGQNIAGWCRLKIKGAKGSEIIVRHGEMLTEEGDLYTENLAAAIQTDRFILSGDEDLFEPRFTYHGFQFIEISGMPLPPDAGNIEAVVVGSDAPHTGSFACSNLKLNKLFSNIVWSQRGNMHGVPTDCPQRDERMGWMGDALVFCQNSMYNMNMAAFYSKWLQDVREAQGSDGAFPDIAPHPDYPDQRFRNAAAWADAGIRVPWLMYLNYGDTDILRRHYTAMTRYVNNIGRKNPGLLRVDDLGNQYGDWLNASTIAGEAHLDRAGVPQDVFATAFYAESVRLLAGIAKIIGKTEDASRYDRLHNDIRNAFIQAFVQPDGTIKGDSQSVYALALSFGLVPEGLEKSVFKHLIRCIDEYDTRISTGFICTPMLMQELADRDSVGLAYRLLESERFPSWLYSVNQGATTIWERWDAYVKGRGFQNAGMNSFNHYSIGAVGEWMYRNILGIQLDESAPAYARIVIRPRPGGSLTWAEGSYESLYGTVSSRWKCSEGTFELNTDIPVNTTATVILPATDATRIEMNGRPVDPSQITHSDKYPGTTLLTIGSGEYRFVVQK